MSQRVGQSKPWVNGFSTEDVEVFITVWRHRLGDIPFHRERRFLDAATANRWELLIPEFIAFAQKHAEHDLEMYLFEEGQISVLYATAVDEALVVKLPKPEPGG